MLICDTHILLTSRQHEIEGRRSVVSANNNTQPCADLLGTLLSHTLEREAKQIGKRRRAIRAPREVKRPTVEFPPTLLILAHHDFSEIGITFTGLPMFRAAANHTDR